MLGLGTEHTYYYHLSAVDMRKGSNGLSGLVSVHMEQERGRNIVYAFINKSYIKEVKIGVFRTYFSIMVIGLIYFAFLSVVWLMKCF